MASSAVSITQDRIRTGRTFGQRASSRFQAPPRKANSRPLATTALSLFVAFAFWGGVQASDAVHGEVRGHTWDGQRMSAIEPWAMTLGGMPWFAAAAVVLAIAGLYVGFGIAPADFQQGEGYRIIFIHVPAAWLSMFLRSRSPFSCASAIAVSPA